MAESCMQLHLTCVVWSVDHRDNEEMPSLPADLNDGGEV